MTAIGFNIISYNHDVKTLAIGIQWRAPGPDQFFDQFVLARCAACYVLPHSKGFVIQSLDLEFPKNGNNRIGQSLGKLREVNKFQGLHSSNSCVILIVQFVLLWICYDMFL